MALLCTQPLTWTASALTVVFVPHYLGARGLGEYAVALTVASIAGTIADFGVSSFLTREASAGPERAAHDGSAAFILLTGVSIAVALAVLVVLPVAGLAVTPVVLGIALAGMVVATAESVLFSMLIAGQRYARMSWLNALGTLASTCTSIAVLVAGGGVVGFMATYVATSVAIFVPLWRFSRFSLRAGAFSRDTLIRLVRGGAPFLAWNITLRIYGEIDRLLLALFSPQAVIGWYAAAYRIVSISLFVPTLIMTPLLPTLTRQVHHDAFEVTLRRSMLAALTLTVPLAALMVALAPDIPRLLRWPREFDASAPLMAILALHEPIVAVDMVLATALVASGRERRLLAVGIVAAFFNPALNLVSIPLVQSATGNGAIAAAAVTVLTEVLMFVGVLWLLPRGSIDAKTASAGLRVLLAGAALVLIAAALRPFAVGLAIVAGTAAYAVLIFALRVFTTSELRGLWQVSVGLLPRKWLQRVTAGN